MDASQSDSVLAPPPPPSPLVEHPQEAEARGGEAEGYEVLISKVQKLMDMITSSQDNPNSKVLHALASILEDQESKYLEETGHISPNNARSSHNIGRLANVVQDNGDFSELVSSKFLLETRYSIAIQAAALRILLICSPALRYPYLFEDDVLENIKNWVMDSSASTDDNDGWKLESGKKTCSDLEMRSTYSTGLLAVCLTGAGQLIEDVLTSGVSAKLMHYLRVRVLGEKSARQSSHAMEKSRSASAVGSRGRDEGRFRMRQPLDTTPFNDSKMLEDGTLLDQYPMRNHDRNVGQQLHEEGWLNGDLHDDVVQGVDDYETGNIEGLQHTRDVQDAKLKIYDRNFPGQSIHDEDIDDSTRDDLLRRRVTRGLPRSRERTRAHEGVLEIEQHLVSPGSGSRLGQICGNVESSLNNLDVKLVSDAITLTDTTCASEKEDHDTCFEEYKVGSKDISALIRSAVRAAETEAKAANAPPEAVKAAGDAAAELVRSAALDEFATTNDEDAACLAASRAASTVIDAATAIEVSRNLIADGATSEISKSSDADMESVEDIVDITIPDSDFLAQQREKFCIRCLDILGEYIEVLGPVLQEKGVDVCIGLLQRYSKLQESEALILLRDVLKLICALSAHRKFAALFVDRGGIQTLLDVPRVSYTFFGLSSCLFSFGSLQGVMEHVCTLPSNIVHQVVELGLQLLECSQDQARKNAALFFAAVFVFRAILDAFDALDGLRKLLNLLHEAASVRSGVNSTTSTPSVSVPIRNDRSNAEVLTSSEKQIAYHTCVALRQYFRAQLLLLVDFIRPNKSSRIAARNIPSVRAAHKPLDISNEAIDAVFLQIQKDRKLGPALVRARWSAVNKFLACNGHITMLELCQAPPVERYLRDLLQYALGVLQIVTLVHYSRKLVVTATLSNDRVGIAVIIDAASGPGYSDPEIIKQALNVLVNLVCPPPSISNKPALLAQGQQSAFIRSSNGPSMETRGRNGEQDAIDQSASIPNQNEPREHNGVAGQTPVSSGLVGDRRITLGAGAGCAGLAAQLEQGYCQARDAVRSYNGIKVLLQLMQTRIVTPPAMLNCVRALACRALLGLARDETIAHILTKLQVGKKLSEIIRDLSSQMPGTEQSRWQTELTQVSLELIAIVTNFGRASTLAATDAATPTLRRIERAAIAAATPITYHSRELLLLVHEHLQACGLSTSAATLLKEAQLTPLPSLVAPSSLVHHVYSHGSPRVQFQWPSDRSRGGFLSSRTKSMARHDSLKIKPLSSTLRTSRNENHISDALQTLSSRKVHGTSVKSFESTSAAEAPILSTVKSTAEAETQFKTTLVLPIKRKAMELKEMFSSSGKRLNTSDQGLRSPVLQTSNILAFGLKDSCGRRTPTPQAASLHDNTTQHCDLQPGGAERLTLDSIVAQYLKHQHRQCPAPITTLPPLSLLHPHVCPEPKRAPDAPLNVTARLSTREYRNMYGGIHGNRRDRQFIYSRYRPLRTCRDDTSSLQTSIAFLKDSLLAIGFHSGELKIFDTYHNNVLETCLSHQSPVTIVQSYYTDSNRLLLSSSSRDVRLWDASSISGGPIHSFDECRHARFGNSGTMFAALPLDSTKREILLYDVRTYKLDLKLSDPFANASVRGHACSVIHFNPLDTMLLWNGVLWDPRAAGLVHRFDQFTDYGGGGFHPAGNEVIINSEVWDLRKLRLLRSVPSLDQTTIKFNSQGDVIYANLRRNLDDTMSVVHTRRAKHPLFASFRTLDAINYSDIATVAVDRCVLDFANEPTDSVIGLVTLDDPNDMISSARIYEVGRRKPTDDDSDPDDADDSDEDDDDEEGRGLMLGPILEDDGDSGNDGDGTSDGDDGSDIEVILGNDGVNEVAEIATEGEEEESDDSLLESDNSEDEYLEEEEEEEEE